ncbi:MAG: RNA-binding protein [Deltaproteobacteria bacterium]|nr:RNA-binding protein [Deltaproteobacteria bacterium]
MNDRHTPETFAEVRIDKWLWAARFFKTRSLAAAAVAGGKVALNGARPKPSRTIRPGDHLNIRRGVYEWIIIVKATSTYRRPAAEVRALYEETEESRSRRQAALAQLKLERPADFHSPGRPSKKDRRMISKFTNRRW